MPDQRSVMKEYRYLDEKRLAQGLTPAEEARLARLRELVGPEAGAGGLRPGFDVNAAAAALRESLLPAGLRNRPPPTPVAPAPAPEPELEPAPAAPDVAGALASEYDQAPFAPLEGEAAAQPDALFDPASLGAEPQAYDPNAQAYDPAQGYDPSQPYDPNAQPYDPNAYPADGTYDASGQPAWDPNQPWDPNAQPYDPSAQPYDPNAQPYDPNAYPAEGTYDASGQPAAWDPNQPWDPNAQPSDPGAQPYDPNAQPYDPNAYPADGAYGASGQPAWDPNQPYDGANFVEEAEPVSGVAAPPEGGSFTAGDAGSAAGWDAEPPPPEPSPAPEFGEYDAAGGAEQPALADTLFGDMPEPEPEPEAAQAVAAEPELGEYDDTAGFGAEPFDASSVPADAPGLDADADAEVDADSGAVVLDPTWQPETALEGGFELASGGSFGAGADAAAPEWAQVPAPPPWQESEPLDLGAPPEPASTEDAAGYEVAPAPPSETFNTLPPAGGDLFGAPEGDLLPPESEPVAAPDDGTAGPELDFSQPELSAAEEPAPEPPPADPAVFESLSDLPPEEANLEAGAPEPELELSLPPPEEPEGTPWAGGIADAVAEADALAEVALPEETVALNNEEIVDVAVTELAGEADLAAAAEPQLAFGALDEAAATPEPPAVLAPEPPASVLAPPPPEAAEEDIPVIDGADILEEIVEEVPAVPPQSLDFEPLVPAAPEPAPAAGPDYHVPGVHRVVMHTVEGLVKRGVLEDAVLDAPALSLAPQPGAPSEVVSTEKVKAIFFMLSPGEKAPAAEGKKVRVTFRDGRQIAGFSPDWNEEGIGFFMIPADTRTNTGRIWVFRAAVRQVTVS